MAEKLWYYVDADQQKIGPVTAGVIKDAYQRGVLRQDTLVWHAELAQWQSLADHSHELGINLLRSTSTLPNGQEVKYANFFHRWAAFIFDQWLLSLGALLLVTGVAASIYFLAGFSFEKNPDAAAILMACAMLSYMFLYFGMSGSCHIYFETSSRQGSWGKQYLGLVVTNDKGERLDRKTAALRWFSAALSHLSQNIGFLMAAFTQKRQALHDYLANTLVLERDPVPQAMVIDRNKRSAIILIIGILVMPILMATAIMAPMFFFIQKQEQTELVEHQKIAALVVPIQEAIGKRVAVDQQCLTHDDPEIKPLLQPLKPITKEIYVGISEDEQACEIYLNLDGFKTLSYRYTSEGDWSCEASHKPEHFGKNCQGID
jgi:uncharacterized RDD family membrane protein YckC